MHFQIFLHPDHSGAHSYSPRTQDIKPSVYSLLWKKTKTLGFSLLPELKICWSFHMFSREQKNDRIEGGTDIWLWRTVEAHNGWKVQQRTEINDFSRLCGVLFKGQRQTRFVKGNFAWYIDPLLLIYGWQRNVHSRRNLPEVSDKACARVFLHSLAELFYSFLFLYERVLIERRPLAGLSWNCYLAETSPSVLRLSLLSLPFLQGSDSAAVAGALRFHAGASPAPPPRSWAQRVRACLSVHGHVYTRPPVSPP